MNGSGINSCDAYRFGYSILMRPKKDAASIDWEITTVSMKTVWIVIVLASLALPHPGNAQGQRVGKNDFEKFCTECHGMNGKGDGPRAKTPEKQPADLTKLAEKKRGRFPRRSCLRSDRRQSRGVDSRHKGHAGMGGPLYTRIEGENTARISAGSDQRIGPCAYSGNDRVFIDPAR